MGTGKNGQKSEDSGGRRFVHLDVISACSTWASSSTPEAYVRNG